MSCSQLYTRGVVVHASSIRSLLLLFLCTLLFMFLGLVDKRHRFRCLLLPVILLHTGPRHFTKQVAVTYRAFWIRSDQVVDVGLVFLLTVEAAFFLLLLRLLLLRLSREKQKHELEKAPLAFKVVSSSVVGRANASSTVAVSVSSAFLLLRRPLCPLLLHIHHTQGPI